MWRSRIRLVLTFRVHFHYCFRLGSSVSEDGETEMGVCSFGSEAKIGKKPKSNRLDELALNGSLAGLKGKGPPFGWRGRCSGHLRLLFAYGGTKCIFCF